MFGIGRCLGFGSGGFGFGRYGYGSTNWIIPLAMGVSRIIILAAIIYFIYKLFTTNKQNYNVRPAYSPAIDILNERLAKGEISEEEYNAIKQKL
jgi:Predicted membrane protein